MYTYDCSLFVVPTKDKVNFEVAMFVDDEKPALAIYKVDERFKFTIGARFKALLVYLYN